MSVTLLFIVAACSLIVNIILLVAVSVKDSKIANLEIEKMEVENAMICLEENHANLNELLADKNNQIVKIQNRLNEALNTIENMKNVKVVNLPVVEEEKTKVVEKSKPAKKATTKKTTTVKSAEKSTATTKKVAKKKTSKKEEK